MEQQAYSIPVRSITYAMKAQKALERYGIRSAIKRDRTIRNGCGYKLTAWGDLAQIMQILQHNGVEIVGEVGKE